MIRITIVREISKLCMFTILWAFPLLLTYWSGNNNFLWFFILSFIVTVGVFSHYEDLERTDKLNRISDESDE